MAKVNLIESLINKSKLQTIVNLCSQKKLFNRDQTKNTDWKVATDKQTELFRKLNFEMFVE